MLPRLRPVAVSSSSPVTKCHTLQKSPMTLPMITQNIRNHHSIIVNNRNSALLSPQLHNPNYYNHTINVTNNYNNSIVSLHKRGYVGRPTPRRKKKMKEYFDWLREHRKKQRAQVLKLDEKIEVDQKYAVSLSEGIKRVCRLSRLTNDETVELECHLNLDPRKGVEYIRGNIVLPHGTGAQRKICVFLQSDLHDKAVECGADIIGDDKLLAQIGDGMKPPFDVCIATPDQLRRLVPFGRQLGPLGLMPNPKMGTLTADPIKAIQAAKHGQVPVRMIEGGVIQGRVGKVSFGEQKILENITSFLLQLRDDLRPPGAKQQYFLKLYLSSSQGRSYQVLVDEKEPFKKISK